MANTSHILTLDDHLTYCHMLLFLTEAIREGQYSTGEILFTSETNNVNVSFTSDDVTTRSGFTLDVQSISCADRPQYPQQINYLMDWDPYDSDYNYGCVQSAQEVVVAGGEVLQGALVSDTGHDGKYPNNACQNWNIRTDENQVYYVIITPFTCCFTQTTLHMYGVVNKPKIMDSNVSVYCHQCW